MKEIEIIQIGQWRWVFGRCLAIALVVLVSEVSAAGDWFEHEFGELRSYHKNWLAICTDKGKGICRTVQAVRSHPLVKSQTFFSSERLAVIVVPDVGYLIEISTATSRGPYVLEVDGTPVQLLENQWLSGDYYGGQGFIYLCDTSLNAKLVELFRKGNRVRVYRTDGYHLLGEFSLIGVTASLNAISDLYESSHNIQRKMPREPRACKG